MLLSEFLKLHGDNKLKKACRIKESTWRDMMLNLRPPSKTIAENIVCHLGGDSLTKRDKYRQITFSSYIENPGTNRGSPDGDTHRTMRGPTS